MTDPFAATWVVLPIVLVGLWAIEQRPAMRRLRPPRALRTFEVVVLVALWLIIAGRHSLGIGAESPGLDPLLAGSLFALLALHVVTLLPGLIQGYAEESSRWPSWPYWMLPLIVALAVLPWSAAQRELDGDEPYFLLIAHSLIHDFDTDLANNYADQDSLAFISRPLEPSWADPKPQEGRRYSRHGPLFPLLLVPGYGLAGRWGAMLTMVALAALVGWLSLALFVRYWGSDLRREAASVWILLASMPPLLLYSHQIWIELPATVLVLLALLRIRDLSPGGERARRSWLWLGVLLLLLPVLKLRFAVISASLLGLAWWRGGRSRKALLWGGVAVFVVLGSILVYNLIAFENPLKDHTLDQLLKIQGRSPIEYLRGLGGLFWDCAFGLVSSNPLWLLLLPALVLAIRQRAPALLDTVIVTLPYLLLIAPRREWFGAWSPPFRFGMVLLPLGGLLLVPLLRRRESVGARGLMVGLSIAAIVLGILWVSVPGWTYNLATGTNHLIDHLAFRLSADVGRLLPSMVRPRAATWWFPTVTTLVVIAFWWFPRRRTSDGGVWATALLLVLLAAVPVAATRLPSKWIELEDRQVVKSGGQLYPNPWTPFRPQYRGGWSLAAGESLRVPVVSGGDRARIRIDANPVGPSSAAWRLELLADQQPLGELGLTAGSRWQSLTLVAVDWPAGAALVVAVKADNAAGRVGRVVLDRVRFDWQ